ncbi:HD domain-containing protein [Micromonospora sp. NPDC049497]|uniref:HD domain-containing protein n=1 Tax=Micromonospora sp. NPDC049497 TaxID=3364273 RepID=UPI0037B4B025
MSAAKGLAEGKLATSLPRRWEHVKAVADKAPGIAPILGPDERPLLVAAAWLHDIGYAPDIVETGSHALDGARWLRSEGCCVRLAALVAHHSCALFEAEERGLAAELRTGFADEETELRDALWYADMTTGPDGQALNVHDRLAEVRARYGPEHLVTRFWARAEPTLLAAVRRTEKRLAGREFSTDVGL